MKKNRKLLSLILCLFLLVTSLPLSVNSFAISNRVSSNEGKTIDRILTVKEIPDKRDIYSKTYETSVGTNVLISSTSPLHYEKDGELIEIDNTLVESEKDASILTNKSNDFSVELPKAFSKDSNISLEFEGNEISFKLLDTENSRSKNAKIEKAEDFSTDNKKAEELAFVESNINKLSSTVKYENIFEKSDVEFTVNSNGFKENIILSSVPSNDYEIRYELSTNGMNASLSDDNSITVSNASGEPIFVVESPYMYDSIGNESEKIITQLNKTENGYELVYIPDGEWLANKETVYPVTIDPTITIKKTGSNVPIEDTYISSTLTNNKSTLSTVAVQNSSSKSWGVYNIKTLPQLPANSVIKNSTFNVFTTTNVTNPSNIILTALPENATVPSTYISTVVWSTRINPTDNIIDAVRTPSTPAQMSFDITELATKWYQDLNMNRIMVLQARDGTTKTTIASCENTNTSKYPYMTVEYATLEKEYKETDLIQDHGLAGTTYIDDYTGTLSYKRTDFRSNSSIGEITFYYGENVNTPQNNMFGLNSSMSFFKTIVPIDYSHSSYVIKYADGKEETITNGGLYNITETNDEIIVNYDDGIEGYSDKYSKRVFEDNEQIPLVDHSTINHSADGASEYHTVSLLYNEDGYLCEIGNELLRCTFEYTDDGIYSITAESPSAPVMRSYEIMTELFEQLSSMDESDPDYENVLSQYEEAASQYEALVDDYKEAVDISNGNHVETNTVYYAFENNSVEISYECDLPTYSQPKCYYTYDNQSRITSVTDENGLMYDYQYNDNNQVVKITEKTADSEDNIIVGDSISFDYGLGYTTVSNGSKSMTRYYDDNGNILSETNEKGISVFYQYDSNNHLIGKSKERYSSGSVLAFCGFEDVNDVMFTAANGTASFNSTVKHSGSTSAKLVSNNGTNAAFTKSFNNLNANTTYTISMWVKSDSAINCGLRLSNGDTDGIRTLKPFTSSTDWQRVYCTIDTENSTSINAEIVVDSTASTIIVYADDIALQQSCYLLSDNLLINGDFSDGLTGWTCSNANYATTETVSSYILTFDTVRLKMFGKINDANTVSQIVSISDFAGAKYTFGGWINTADAAPAKASSNRDLNISIYAISNNNTETLIDTIDYSAYYSGWQYFEHEISLPTDFGSNNTYSALKLVVNYNNQYGNIYVDGLFLTQCSLYPIEYIYDTSFNLIGINNDGNITYYEEEETVIPATIETEYDEYGNMIQRDVYTEVEENPTPTEVSRHIINQFEYLNRGTMLTKKISQFGNWADLKYDRFGNLSYFNDENGCIARFEYDNFQNLAAIIKEFDNKNFTDDYEKIHLRVDGGNETEIPTEKTEMTICYSYVGNRLSTIETKYITKTPRPLQEPEVGYVTDPESGAVIYDISNELTINKYSFDYDIWGNLTSVCVDNNGTPVPFVQYSYDNTNYRQLTSIQYNNGQLINYSYDSDGNVIHTYDTYSDTGDTLSYNYYYLDNGKCYGKKDLKTNITESIQNSIKTVLEANGRVIYASQESTSNSIVKRIGNNYVIKTVNGDSQTITVNGLSSTLTRTYDDFGRLYTERYHVDNNHNDYGKIYYYYAHGENLTEEFSEQNLEDGYQYTSNYVRGIQYVAISPSEEVVEGPGFSYLYWFNGNTATYTPNDTRVFGYNSAGMLLESSVILGGESRYYTYNSQGNISDMSTVTKTGSDIFHLSTVEKKHFSLSYDEANSGTVLKNCLTSIQEYNINLSTEDESLLKTYTFEYDYLGNLTSLKNIVDETIMNTTTYTWCRGTMLKDCIVSNNITHETSNSVHYKYDDNNMLIQKVVDLGNNNSMVVNYIWEGNCLVGTEIDNSAANDITAGKYNTVILYDPDGNAYGLVVNQTEDYQGLPSNYSELCYYIKNNDNVITGIVDANGEEVLECSYGDFGAPTLVDYTTNNVLTLVNPLLLKDNIYDNEMGMYFIDSRFYNPSFGRYISADMSFGQNDKSFLSTNLYVYNKNNPIG